MFIDRVKVRVKAGDGGKGCASFRREKFVPHGGPDGGNGGRGGSVLFRVDPGETTLVNLHSRPFYHASDGENGLGKNKHGSQGKDIILKVPPGTVIHDMETDVVIGELLQGQTEFLVARGGKGGWGNAHFATSTRRSPRLATAGEQGQELSLLVELKLVAQGGLVGFPNSGKSTLLGTLTKAHPKIAEYPFTTLHPVLGTMGLPGGFNLVLADIPGIIQGAHDGVGLGLEFLKHIERTLFLIVVLDLSDQENWPPQRAYNALFEEMEFYDATIPKRPHLIVFNKVDLLDNEEQANVSVRKTLSVSRPSCRGTHVISAKTGRGLEQLREAIIDNAPQWLKKDEDSATSQ